MARAGCGAPLKTGDPANLLERNPLTKFAVKLYAAGYGLANSLEEDRAETSRRNVEREKRKERRRLAHGRRKRRRRRATGRSGVACKYSRYELAILTPPVNDTARTLNFSGRDARFTPTFLPSFLEYRAIRLALFPLYLTFNLIVEL